MNKLSRFFLTRLAPGCARVDEQELAQMIADEKRSSPVYRRFIGPIFVISLITPFVIAVVLLAVLNQLDEPRTAAPLIAAAVAFLACLLYMALQAVLLACILGARCRTRGDS